MAVWRVDLFDLNAGSPRLSNIPIRDQDYTFSYVPNGPGAFDANLVIDDPVVTRANFARGQRELKVYRDNILTWAGYFWTAHVQLGPGDIRDLTIHGEGYWSRLRDDRRVVMSSLDYPTTAQQTIAWNLIAHTQAQGSGNLGFSQGAHTGGTVNRTRRYCRGDHDGIAEAIEELAGMDDGIDFEITPTPTSSADKVFRTYQPRKGVASGLTLTKFNELAWDEDAMDVASRVLAEGEGDCAPATADVSDATALADYLLLQAVITADQGDLTDLTAHANEVLRTRKVPRWQPEITFHEAEGPAWGTYDIGDTITLSVTKGYATVNQLFRIAGIKVHIHEPNVAMFTLSLDQVT